MGSWGTAPLSRPLVRALLVTVLFGFVWSFLHVSVFRRDFHKLNGDVAIYQRYAEYVQHGQLPYRDFDLEYPPGALPAIVPPVYASSYETLFEVEMLVCGLALAFLLGLVVSRPSALLFVAVSPVLIGDLAITRFDLWPVLLLTGALVALGRDRHALGWGLLGAAFVAKGYAAVAMPFAAVWTFRRAGRAALVRSLAWGGGVVAAVLAPFVVLAPGGMWSSFSGQVSRPLQIESLGGSFLMAAKRATIINTHGSANIDGTPAQVLATVIGVLGLGALAWCWLVFLRRMPAQADRVWLYQAVAAAVCAFIAFGKVLSPQYLIWLVPLVVLIPGRRGLAAVALLTAAFLLTHWWIPSRYYEYKLEFQWAWVVVARNLLLVALFALLAWPRSRRSLRAGRVPGAA